MRVFEGDCINDIRYTTQREWLITNGAGAYASSTLSGMSTRRYHGLLIACPRPLVDRRMLIAKLQEVVVFEGERTELDCNRYPGVVHPCGYKHLVHVDAGGLVVTHRWAVAGGTLERRIAMRRCHNVTGVVYKWIGPEPITLELRPLTACRSYHHLQREHREYNGELHVTDGHAWLQPYSDASRICIGAERARVVGDPLWYYGFEYDRERERGLDFVEDLFSPGLWTLDLRPYDQLGVTLGTEPVEGSRAKDIVDEASARERSLLRSSPLGSCEDGRVRSLVVSSDSFLARRADGATTVVAGYHWFTDWGRDAMIALPGLTLAHGRHEVAKAVVLGFVEAMSHGLVPNRFPDYGEQPEYNTADGTLWLFVAAKRVVDASDGGDSFARELWPALRDSIEWHLRGTRHGIAADEDTGLLWQGGEGEQLTWMDVKIGDWVVTPRTGWAVEIQALWVNALLIAAEFGDAASDPETPRFLRAWAERAMQSFVRLFWLDDVGYLADVVTPAGVDRSLRPNQVIALSLPYPLLSNDRAARALRAVEAELLTPVGLRTLAPSDPSYRGLYGGFVAEREVAYHQGTVWPWLLGPYVRAYLRVHAGEPGAYTHARRLLEPVLDHVDDAGIGTISEICDGDMPHAPKGCIAQAWSVGEIVDLLVLLQEAQAQ